MAGPTRSLVVVIVGVPLLAVGLASCGSSPKGGANEGKVHVEAALYPLEWLVEQVGGADVQVSSLTPPGAEPHDLELTPKEVARVVDADLVVVIGGFQPTVDDALDEARGSVFDVADATALDLAASSDDEVEAGAAHDHETGRDARGVDPHVWLDPVKFAEVATALGDRLARLDPPHAAAYRRRALAAHDLLAALADDIATATRSCRSRDLVTAHAAFGYFSRRFDLHQISITGISPGVEPSPKRLAEVASLVRDRGVRTVYFERLVPDDLARTVARETGARVAVLDPIEGITDDAAGHDYPSVMEANVRTLVAGQGCS